MAQSLREEMPTVAAWIDDLRAACGPEMINAAIRAGLDGQPTFHAVENGLEVGTPSQPAGYIVSGEDLFAHIPLTRKKP